MRDPVSHSSDFNFGNVTIFFNFLIFITASSVGQSSKSQSIHIFLSYAISLLSDSDSKLNN